MLLAVTGREVVTTVPTFVLTEPLSHILTAESAALGAGELGSKFGAGGGTVWGSWGVGVVGEFGRVWLWETESLAVADAILFSTTLVATATWAPLGIGAGLGPLPLNSLTGGRVVFPRTISESVFCPSSVKV